MRDRPTYEWKFVGAAAAADVAMALLRHACFADPVFRQSTVRSLYYDTPTLEAYGEKRNSEFLKTKVRLRWYEPDVSAEPSTRLAFLEVKSKEGRGRRKVRRRLSLDRRRLDAAGLDDPGFLEGLLRDGDDEVRAALRGGLLPALVIAYRRDRFVCPASLARVCLDTAIRVERTNPRLLPAHGNVDVRRVVLEIKGDPAVSPPWCGAIVAAGLRLRSFSKYGECVAQLLGEEAL